MTCLLFYLRYSHNALRFTNHVGEQRNFCKQKCDVPLLVCLSNSTLSAQRSAYFFKTLYGTTFPHTTRLHKFMNNQTLPLRAGCRGRQPLQSFRQIRCAAKSLRSLRILRCAMGWKKRCRVFHSDTALFFDFYFLYEGILILFALYHQYWIAVKIRFHGFRIFVCILKYLICQFVSRF